MGVKNDKKNNCHLSFVICHVVTMIRKLFFAICRKFTKTQIFNIFLRLTTPSFFAT